jgi:hypothetical protein
LESLAATEEATMRAVLGMLLVLVIPQILHSQMSVNPKWECRGAEALSAEQMIALLNSEMDRQSHESSKCICAYVESLAIARDERAMPAIARYLDLPNPLTGAEVKTHLAEQKWTPLGGQYPAEEALGEFHQRARPVLIQTIQSETTFTQKSENALELFMVLSAVHPDRAIRMLVDAAAKTRGTQAEMLHFAVSKAVASPECERVRPNCEDAASANQNTGMAKALVAAGQTFTLTVSTPHDVVAVGDDIRVDVVLVNATDHAIPRPPISSPTCEYRIEVKSKVGLTISEPVCSGSRLKGLPIKPKERMAEHMSLTMDSSPSGKFDFSIPGEYDIQFSRWDPNSASVFKSNKTTVRVLPNRSDPE